MAIAAIAIFIIGAEILPLAAVFFFALDDIIRFVMKNSKFTKGTLIFFKNTVLLCLLLSFSCRSQSSQQNTPIVAANQTEAYLTFLKGKNIAVVANQTSVIFKNGFDHTQGHTHLVDSLLSHKIPVKKVFAPEHGFRGTADAGELVKDGKDHKTGLPIVSLYGSNKKPSQEQLRNIDVVIFDIQDVGARFYTYISTLHYMMEACAEADITLLVLDRPNPNIHYVDGPVLEEKHKSFVGMHPIPVVHGMTVVEYAQMINGEKWLANRMHCSLKVIPVKNYTRQTPYSLPIKPSPNLPNDKAINLYPSLCFFEGTSLSEGRGTDMQFQVFGSPNLPKNKFHFQFTPKPNQGAKHPKFNGQLCYGKDLRNTDKLSQINLEWLIEAYESYPDKDTFFTKFFTTLAGTEKLQKQIENGLSFSEIKESWQKDIKQFKKMRAPYLIYPTSND